MKSYSFLREAVPGTLRSRGGLSKIQGTTERGPQSAPRLSREQQEKMSNLLSPLPLQDALREVELCGQELCPGEEIG
ncbi:hypothetical protein P7K49_019780 [Saguinus oedipus]|uniref:Uncharacterized protein n=1 Tax=Saguinus oedipus TaxID=9490 RepID=A0ABQ9V048_SAGOE|nr:hypothetical protein P7K49_019780 [Saguinus oedipus]